MSMHALQRVAAGYRASPRYVIVDRIPNQPVLTYRARLPMKINPQRLRELIRAKLEAKQAEERASA